MVSIIISCVIFVLQLSFSLGDIIQLPNGQINGYRGTTFENVTYYGFIGIPYAAPPVGELRFKPPQPAVNWDGVLETTTWDRICYQLSTNSDNESEDCLLINIFTPDLPSEGKNVSLPVMLFIHGGAFETGDGGTAADLYMNNGVVFVTINYRIGLFGFISTQDEIIPGNNGLKDQRFAIQWLNDNVHLFGGDPNQITIVGQSAGSASVAYQLLNQDNNGLFQAAILQSGTSLNPWAFQRNARKIAFKTASFLNSTFENSDDSQALLDYLLTVDARDLDEAASQYRDDNSGPQYLEVAQGFYWAPVIEVKNPDAFITKKMYSLVEAGNVLKVPILIGDTSEEMVNQGEDDLRALMAAYDENLSWLVPNDMQISDETQRTEMGSKIRDIYTGGEPLTDHLGDAVRYCSDTDFTRAVIKYAELFSKVADVYFYIFSYYGEIGGESMHYDGAGSVAHTQDLPYFLCWGTTCDPSNYAPADVTTRRRLIKLWTDFAKYKNPTPEPSELLQNITWPAVFTDDGDFFYLDIDENLEVKNHPKETYSRWNELYASLNFTDFDTY